jgi:hypothetical protein
MSKNYIAAAGFLVADNARAEAEHHDWDINHEQIQDCDLKWQNHLANEILAKLRKLTVTQKNIFTVILVLKGKLFGTTIISSKVKPE